MSSTEAAFSYTVKDSGGNLCTLRGDTYGEFAANAQEAFGPAADALLSKFGAAFGATSAGSTAPSLDQAVATVQQTFPQAAPVSTVGQPLPQPGIAAPPAAAPAAAPPGTPSCAHGVMTYKSSNTKNGIWNRYECAIPWSRDAVGRCANVNAR